MSEVLGKDIYDRFSEGFTIQNLEETFGKDKEKIKKLLKKYRKDINEYNSDHVYEKYELNERFFNKINPKTILDAFCGVSRYWATEYSGAASVISNDNMLDPNAKPDDGYTYNAKTLLKKFYKEGVFFDLIDIDPYNSSKDYIDLGFELSKKGVIFTFGEFPRVKRYHKKYLNYFRKNFGIDSSSDDMTIEKFSEYLVERSGGKFKVFGIGEWKTCCRIYLERK